MADVLISELQPVVVMTDGMLFETEQGVDPNNESLKVTLAQIKAAAKISSKAVTPLSIAAGAVVINLSLGDFFTLALTSNVTSLTFTNLPAAGLGTSFALRFRQDATGNRTVTLPASFKAISGSAVAVSLTANSYTLLTATTFDQGLRWEFTMQGVSA